MVKGSTVHPIRRDDERGIFAVHRSVYTDPEIQAREQERIFDRCWLYAAHVSELKAPGDFIARKIANRRIFLVRGKDGNVRAFFNACTHKGAMICRENKGSAKLFSCPYHAWTFDTSGTLMGVPDSESFGPNFEREEFNLNPVPRCDISHGFIFVSFASDGESLPEHLGPAAECLSLLEDNGSEGMQVADGSFKYSIAANWKLLLENSNDAYHVPATHRRYLDYLKEQGGGWANPGEGPRTTVTPLGKGHCVFRLHDQTSKMTGNWGGSMPESLRPGMEARRAALEARHGKERADLMCDTFAILQIFPNLLILESVSTIIRQFFPNGVGSLDVNSWALMPSDLDEDDRAYALRSVAAFWGPGGFGSADDVDILESCQMAFTNREAEWSLVSRGMLADRPPRFDDDLAAREFWKRWGEIVAPEPDSKSNLVPFAARGA